VTTPTPLTAPSIAKDGGIACGKTANAKQAQQSTVSRVRRARFLVVAASFLASKTVALGHKAGAVQDLKKTVYAHQTARLWDTVNGTQTKGARSNLQRPDTVGISHRQGRFGAAMPDDNKKTKPKTMTLKDLLESKHGPAALTRMAGRPGLTLGGALKEIREERGEGGEEDET